eukprot:6455411-Amphidinium_carterae.1
MDIDARLAVCWELDWWLRGQLAQHGRNKSQLWREWAVEQFIAGTAAAYRMLRDRPPSPQDALEDGWPLHGSRAFQTVVHQWWSLWTAHGGGEVQGAAGLLPPLTPEQLQASARSMGKRKAVGGDGWHPRCWLQLDGDFWARLAGILDAWERLGGPILGQETCVVLLPKPGQSGMRPIALTNSLMRLWSAARKSLLKDAEGRIQRHFHGGTAHLRCNVAGFLAGVLNESARHQQESAINLLADISKAYEHVQHPKLVEEAAAFGLGPLARQACQLYRTPRHILMDGQATRAYT